MQRRQLLPILLPYSTENGAGVTLRTAKLAGPLEAASRRSGDAITEATKTVGEALGASARQLEAETDKLSIRAGAIASTLE